MASSNCFICGNEVTSEKTIINKISICLKCLSESDPADDFKAVKAIIAAYKSSKEK